MRSEKLTTFHAVLSFLSKKPMTEEERIQIEKFNHCLINMLQIAIAFTLWLLHMHAVTANDVNLRTDAYSNGL